MIAITNPNQLDRYEYVFFAADNEADATAQFVKKYPWGETITAAYRLRKDYYFPVSWKRVFDYRKAQVTG